MKLSLTLTVPQQVPSRVPSSVFFSRAEDGTWTRTAHYEYHSVVAQVRRVPRAVLELESNAVRWDPSRRKASVATLADTYRSDDAKALVRR